MERQYSIKEFCERAKVGRSTVYRENKAGRLRFRKIGRATRIAESDAKAWLDSLETR